jgi:hypothetical protein
MKKTKMRGLTDKVLIAALTDINNVLNNHAAIINAHSAGLRRLAELTQQGTASIASLTPPEPIPGSQGAALLKAVDDAQADSTYTDETLNAEATHFPEAPVE